MNNGIDTPTKKQHLSFSVGYGLTKTGNLKPVTVQSIQQLEDIVNDNAVAIGGIITQPRVRTRNDYHRVTATDFGVVFHLVSKEGPKWQL